ncbi:MAG: fibronectin type III [Parcubacteria group bacterium LiPW_15]|nr:MAG: fibronectin type III [Parcubacteria group bacterium LiPW_15]
MKKEKKNSTSSTSKFLFVVFFCAVFLTGGFSGLIWGIPSANAAIPTFVGCGAAAGAAAAITPVLPAGIAANDILLLFLETSGQAITIANGNGGTWTEVSGSPQSPSGAVTLTVFWSRYNGTQGDPTTSDSGNHQGGSICAYRGVVTTGNPWDVTSGSVDATSDVSGDIAGATTIGPDRLVVIVGAGATAADTPIATVVNSSLANISAVRVNAETGTGDGGGLTVFDGQKATAGAYSTTTVTFATATVKGMMTISLQPPVTTLANGTDPSNATIAPGASATDLDSFTLQTTDGSDTVTAATVTLGANTTSSLSSVAITSNDGATTYCSENDPVSNTVALSGCGIPVSTSPVQFKVRITPKSHANMPAVPGSAYSVTGTVTSFTGTNSQAGSDASSATITVDNQSPADVTGASGTAGVAQVSLSWTNPGDADLHSIVALRSTSAVTDTPVEGTVYTVGNSIGASIVACVTASPGTGCTDSGLTGGTNYHYKLLSRDTSGNYAAGVVPSGSPFSPTHAAPVTTSISPTTVAAGGSGFSLIVNGSGFDGDSVVRIGGSNRTTTFASSTQLSANILASDISSAGTRSITVFNPTPGGGTSNAQTLTVSSAPVAPTIQSFDASPSSVSIGESQTITFTWSAIGAATTCAITDPGNATIGSGGIIGTATTTQPQTTSAYTLTCTNVAGSDTAVATVTVSSGTSPQPSSSAPPVNLSGYGPANAHFYGYAYPGADIQIFTKSSVSGVYASVPFKTVTIANNGSFEVSLENFLQADYFFAIQAKDKNNNSTAIISFAQLAVAGVDWTIKDIILPPTLVLDSSVIGSKSPIFLNGYAIPGATVSLFVDGKTVGSTKPDSSGYYTFAATSTGLSLGSHSVYAKEIFSGKTSDPSLQKTFNLTTEAKSVVDLNGDQSATISDWSIFLSRWRTEDKKTRGTIDFNRDGKIDIIDFSIFLNAFQQARNSQ